MRLSRWEGGAWKVVGEGVDVYGGGEVCVVGASGAAFSGPRSWVDGGF